MEDLDSWHIGFRQAYEAGLALIAQEVAAGNIVLPDGALGESLSKSFALAFARHQWAATELGC